MKDHHGCPVTPRGDDPSEILTTMTDEDVEQLVRRAHEHLAITHGWLLAAIEEFERRTIAERSYALTPRQWIRRHLTVSRTKARQLVKAAQALVGMPNVRKRVLAGEINPEQLNQLVAARAKHPEHFPVFEETFADIATHLDPKDLATAIGRWSQQIDHAGALAEVDHQRRRRRLGIHQTFDGMWHCQGDLDPASGHIIATALRAKADPSNLDPDDRRTYGQRLADALVDVCTFYLDHNTDLTTSGGQKPHVTVIVGLEQLEATEQPEDDTAPGTDEQPPLPEIENAPVRRETMRRLVCDSAVSPVVVDEDGKPLDVGRTTRTIPGAIRRALDLRDQGCRWDGCDAPVGWTDAHHIHHWADGGPTSLENLMLLCRRHHTVVHEDSIPIRLAPAPPRVGGPPTRPSP